MDKIDEAVNDTADLLGAVLGLDTEEEHLVYPCDGGTLILTYQLSDTASQTILRSCEDGGVKVFVAGERLSWLVDDLEGAQAASVDWEQVIDRCDAEGVNVACIVEA